MLINIRCLKVIFRFGVWSGCHSVVSVAWMQALFGRINRLFDAFLRKDKVRLLNERLPKMLIFSRNFYAFLCFEKKRFRQSAQKWANDSRMGFGGNWTVFVVFPLLPSPSLVRTYSKTPKATTPNWPYMDFRPLRVFARKYSKTFFSKNPKVSISHLLHTERIRRFFCPWSHVHILIMQIFKHAYVRQKYSLLLLMTSTCQFYPTFCGSNIHNNKGKNSLLFRRIFSHLFSTEQ